MLRRLAFVLSLIAGGRFGVPGAGPFDFPRDHAPHDDARVEWWYVTGHLRTGAGRRLGYQLTFFRTGILDGKREAGASAFAARDLYLAHFAMTDVDGQRFRTAQRAHRSGPGAAFAGETRLDVANEDWRLEELGGRFVLRARDGDDELSLLLTPQKPPVAHGAGGLSRKGAEPGAVSRYVSLTRLATEGVWRHGGGAKGVTERVTGQSWFDHEWGPGAIGKDTAGWDWFSVQLADGRDLMLYLLRGRDGAPTRFSSGTLVEKDGAARSLALADVTVTVTERWKSERSGGTYPARWTLRVPQAGLDLDIVPLVKDQELVTDRSTRVTYWEGACDVRSPEGAVLGEAYVELTGYAGSGGLGLLRDAGP